MAKRKINRVGTSTLTVSLPSKWADLSGLKAGDEVEVVEEGRNLRILTGGKSNERRSASFFVKVPEHFMGRMICSPFLKGYDSITIRYDDQRVYGKILGAMKNIVGFEIVEQKEGMCRIEEITKGTEEKFNQLILRLFHVLRSLSNDLKNYLKNPHTDIESILDIEYTCDKLSLYCRRVINKDAVSGKTYDNTGLYHVACLAEQVGDELGMIADFFKENGHKGYKYDTYFDKMFDAIQKCLDVTMKKIDNYMNKRDHALQADLAREQRTLRNLFKSEKKLFFSLKKENLIVYHHLLNTLDLINHMSEELF